MPPPFPWRQPGPATGLLWLGARSSPTCSADKADSRIEACSSHWLKSLVEATLAVPPGTTQGVVLPVAT
jgi:hypothetical protein